MNKLVVVDVDDTLFIDNCKHTIVPDEQGNFSYEGYRKAEAFSRCKPIYPVVDRISSRLADPNTTVAIVTARGGIDDMDMYIDTFVRAGLNIEHDHVTFAGLNKPNHVPTHWLKRPVFEELLDSQVWNDAEIYDDNKTNLVEFHYQCLDRDIPHKMYWIHDQRILPFTQW